MDVTMNSYPTNRRFTGFTNRSSEVIHHTRRKACGVLNLLDSHTGSLYCENTADACAEGKKTTKDRKCDHSMYRVWGCKSCFSLFGSENNTKRDPSVPQCPSPQTRTAGSTRAPLQARQRKPALREAAVLPGGLCSRSRDAEVQRQNLTTSNSPKLVHIGTDTGNVFL